MTRRSLLAVLVSATLTVPGDALAGGGSAPATATSTTNRVATFRNPVIPEDFPDPFILRVGNTYYAYATNSGGVDVPVQRSSDLVSWQFVGNAMPELPQWASGGHTWAPEVMAVQGGYALYFTARHTASGRQCIGVATASRPAGPFKSNSKEPLVCQLDMGGSIDASPFVDADGARYLYWKNDGNCCGKFTAIWAQRLSPDGTKLVGQPMDVLYNNQLWEGNLIEAPNVYRHQGRYYLFYSAADYASETYAVGYAVAPSPTGPFTKVTKDQPWLATSGKIAGPGGQGIIADGRGNTWLYYHAWGREAIGYDVGGQRSMHLNPLEWKGGTPVLRGVNAASQPVPARP